jgi:hypothetical protein
MEMFKGATAKNTMRTTTKVEIKLAIAILPGGNLSRPNSSTCTGGKERNALSDLVFYQTNIDELATFVGVITITLSNVTVSAHLLNVGTVGAIVTTKFVMCLGITNNERQLEVQPHVTYMGYPNHMATTTRLQSKKTLNYTFQTSMVVF